MQARAIACMCAVQLITMNQKGFGGKSAVGGSSWKISSVEGVAIGGIVLLTSADAGGLVLFFLVCFCLGLVAVGSVCLIHKTQSLNHIAKIKKKLK